MLNPNFLSATFRSGDLEFRRRTLAQYWVVTLVKDDPVRCVHLYRRLLAEGGTPHAAETFLTMLEQARQSPSRFALHMLEMPRKYVPI